MDEWDGLYDIFESTLEAWRKHLRYAFKNDAVSVLRSITGSTAESKISVLKNKISFNI